MKRLLARTLPFITIPFIISCVKTTSADLVIHNGEIHCNNVSSEVYDAMAVKDGVIIELGPEHQIMNKYQAEEYVDLKKRPVFPGLYDSHAYFYKTGFANKILDLSGILTVEEIIIQINNIKTELVLATNLESDLVNSQNLIDQINSSDKPIVLKSNNGYTALVNIAASTKYDINHENGKIKNGLQNIWDKVSSESPSQKIESLIMAQQIFTMNGITTTTNLNSDVETIKLLDSLSHEKVIQMRIHLYTDYQVLLNNPMILESLTSTNIILDGINLYIDGPISSEQALLKDTNFYGNGSYGIQLIEDSIIEAAINFSLDNNLIIAFHCLGDSAIGLVKRHVKKSITIENNLRFRIEHAQIFDPSDYDLLNRYYLIPSVQPNESQNDFEFIDSKFSPVLKSKAYQYKSLKSQLGLICFGSLSPLNPPSPFSQMYLAQYLNSKYNSETLSRKECFNALTIYPALAFGDDQILGTLEAGKKGTFVILNDNPNETTKEKLKNITVKNTFIDGVKIY
jgi:predicted amidohydrolase YtcJ|tara:strand:- start:382 stop:1917 length:1536 start_codon:yes stop_codon:yes gene_type:complete